MSVTVMDWSFIQRHHLEFVQTDSSNLPYPEPCLALPGTHEKVQVIRHRALVLWSRDNRRVLKPRERLFHPEDATWEMFWKQRAMARNPKSRWRAPVLVVIDGHQYNWACPVTPLDGFDPLSTKT